MAIAVLKRKSVCVRPLGEGGRDAIEKKKGEKRPSS